MGRLAASTRLGRLRADPSPSCSEVRSQAWSDSGLIVRPFVPGPSTAANAALIAVRSSATITPDCNYGYEDARTSRDALASLGQRSDHSLVESLAHRGFGALDVGVGGGVAGGRVRYEEQAAHHLGHLEILARVADSDAFIARIAARPHVARHGACLRCGRGNEVIGVRLPAEIEGRLAARDLAVVHEAQARVALGREQLAGLAWVDQPSEEVRDLAVEMPGRVELEPPGVALEQQVRGARLANLRVDCEPVARLDVPGEEGQLALDHHAGAHLEDVGALPHEAGVLHHLSAPAPGLDHHLGARAVAGLECAGGEQGEIALGRAEERSALPEQRAVEIGVNAADQSAEA